MENATSPSLDAVLEELRQIGEQLGQTDPGENTSARLTAMLGSLAAVHSRALISMAHRLNEVERRLRELEQRR